MEIMVRTLEIAEQEIKDLTIIHAQLNQALGIIAESNGDWSQQIVYDALIEVGYYDNSVSEEDGNEDISMQPDM